MPDNAAVASGKNLVAHTIPLVGKHLIEASAGTGKTFNITRIYLRLLLERKLTVEQILVMTFTKDATEELRGRIEGFIRLSILQWHDLVEDDPYFAALAEKVPYPEAMTLLKKALLFLDDAAIYTIHGFCKNVLSEHALASGLPFNTKMDTNFQDFIEEACQDWFRTLALTSVDDFLLLAQFWPEPQNVLAKFSKAIHSNQMLEVVEPQEIVNQYLKLVNQASESLNLHNATLVSYLIDNKKGQDKILREEELAALTTWLQDLTKLEQSQAVLTYLKNNAMPDAFFRGNRFGRNQEIKDSLIDIFRPVNQVKEQSKKLFENIAKANAYKLVRQGIYQIRNAVKEKKQQLNMLSFDDLIANLAMSLSNEQDDEAKFAQTLRNQYPVALVDEFQDTDPLQFTIIQALYFNLPTNSNAQASALYMIGDPKQAIYGFRGGDVFAYLAARADCEHQWLMDTNWRSTANMIQGYNRLFYGDKLNSTDLSNPDLISSSKTVFGYDIEYLPVKAAPKKHDEHFENENGLKPLQFVHFSTDDENFLDNKLGKVKQNYRPVMANWCADEIVRLLNEKPINSKYSKRKPQEIAILVRDNVEARAIKEALQSRNLASVYLSNKANLLHSDQAKQLLVLLKGLLFIENERLFSAALACGLLAYTPVNFYQLQGDELAWQNLKFDFEQLRKEWRYKGFIAMALKLMHQHFYIASEDQDRVLTNLLHLFELLQSASGQHQQPQALLYWFEQQIRLDNPDSEAELRLESDENLIRIVTQHGSKGLEYPVVFVPFASRYKDPLKVRKQAVNVIEYHRLDKTNPKHRPLVLSLDGSLAAKQAMCEEQYAEAIRLLYVAITRAEQRCYVLATDFDQSHLSPLGLTLKCSEGDVLLNKLKLLQNDEPDAIGVLQVNGVTDEMASYQNDEQISVAQVATFNGNIERDWWLSSFSALSKNLRHGGVSSPDRDNELLALTLDDEQLSHQLRFTLAKGAQTGNLLHDILEHTDFVEPNWPAVMKWPLVKFGGLTQPYTESELAQWLAQVLNSPLDEAGCCLNEISWQKSLRESEFYFPMSSASSSKLARLLTEHRQQGQKLSLTIDGALSAAIKVNLPTYQTLKGMMHGFIDLVFEHDNKYYVCDYKSTHLGNHYQHYNFSHIKENVEKNYYDLQYLIYCLALHRYLKQTLVDYDPQKHFGGIYYFYLRGMTDDEQFKGAGVYYRQISHAELTTLDEIFLGDEHEK